MNETNVRKRDVDTSEVVGHWHDKIPLTPLKEEKRHGRTCFILKIN